MNKELVELIDRICEDSINNPPVFDNGIFVTDDARIAENTHIAEIASFISEAVIDGKDIEEKLEALGKSGIKAFRLIVLLCRIIRKLKEELEQRQNQMVNLERRLYALEEKPTKGSKYGYY